MIAAASAGQYWLGLGVVGGVGLVLAWWFRGLIGLGIALGVTGVFSAWFVGRVDMDALGDSGMPSTLGLGLLVGLILAYAIPTRRA